MMDSRGASRDAGAWLQPIGAESAHCEMESLLASRPLTGNSRKDAASGVLDTSTPIVANGREKDAGGATKDDARRREVSTSTPAVDTVEVALADALRGATEAGRWDAVSQLAHELEERRRARSGNVVTLPGTPVILRRLRWFQRRNIWVVLQIVRCSSRIGLPDKARVGGA
jgi:hypothetical protein